MEQWLYKATPRKVELAPTRDLALNDGFICRSAYTRPGVRAARTRHVRLGAILHVYFRENGTTTPIGSFEVIDTKEHPNPQWFGARVAKTCLFEVDDPTFEQKLRAIPPGVRGKGYLPDPQLRKMVGWAIRPVAPPPFDPAMFPARHTLVGR